MDSILTQTTEIFQNLVLSRSFFADIPKVYVNYLKYLPILGIAFVSGILLTPIIGNLAQKYNIFDLPAKQRLALQNLRKKYLNKEDNPVRHIHKVKTPLLGGLSVIIPIFLGSLLLLKITPAVIPIIASLLLITIVGVLDDKFSIPAKIQLLIHIIAGLIIAVSTIDLSYMTNPFGGTFNLNIHTYSYTLFGIPASFVFPGDILVIPWIILCINAIKWVGGSDGLMETNSIIAFIMLFVLGIRNQSVIMIVISLLATGSLMGFLIYNFPPAKIFTGSTGKTFFGFLLGVLALVDGAKMATAIIILSVPIIDALVVLIHRMIKYKPKNIFELMKINDTTHLHHQLMDLGLKARQILFIEGALSLFFGMIAVLTIGASKLFALLASVFFVALGISLIHIVNSRKKRVRVDEPSPESKYSY